ncbi:hypothetical protein T11_8735 [Trichinella zimbabwensis]|uniref:Uncharacterized protein n=1 Tax=Trichinella zimbabwensis TaxID=268475 RepID=A0A0V1H4W2_9BILA|nr:hypothetical protein T11_8735 [Trichinella zimbabwensis]
MQDVAAWDKRGRKGALSTDLDVTTLLRQTHHMKACPVDHHLAYKMDKMAVLKKRSAEETKSIPQIYDEEAAAASAEPSTSGQLKFFEEDRNAMYTQRAKRFPRFPRNRQDLIIADGFRRTKSGKVFLLSESASKHIRVFPTANNWQSS